MFYLCVSMMFLMWLFAMSVFHSSLGQNSFLRAYSPGNIIIGGLFPIHLKTNRTNTSGPLSCSDYGLKTFLHSQVMIYAISKINLPNISIGYDIYDTCGDVSLALRATLQLLKNQSDPQSCLVPADAQFDLPDPETKVVIGERYSEVSIAVARLIALSSVAQISYASTSELLSSKFKFPTFLRTVPSDKYQTRGITELVKIFHWKTVIIVGSDDEYGKYGSDSLQVNFNNENICIEFVHILSADFTTNNNSMNQTELTELLEKIQNSSAEAIIIFTKDTNAEIILEAAIRHRVNRTWIASDAWSSSSNIAAMQDIELAGEVFGFVLKQKEVPGFKDHVMSMFNGTNNTILRDYQTQHLLSVNQSEEERTQHLASYIDQDESYGVYLAVRVIAEGLRRLLKCNDHRCERRSSFTASELLSEIQKVNFTENNTQIYFNSDGDPSLGYDIVYWNRSEGIIIQTIGEYSPEGKITVPTGLFSHLINDTVSVYNCSKKCQRGQGFTLKGKCCGVCVPCASGEISDGNRSACKRCTDNQYSIAEQRDQCFNKTDEFLLWTDPFSVILSFLAVVGIIATVVFAVLFAVYLKTPIVKAVGGYLCFLELFALLAGFCLTFTFIGKPTEKIHCVGVPLFGIAFTLCISCILANLLQIFLGFKFDLKGKSWIKKLNMPLVVVTIIFGIQLGLSVSWLTKEPPHPDNKSLDQTILYNCKIEPYRYFIAMLVYNAFLGLICFVFAFKGRELPDLYKNASLITISMLMFVVIWIIFLPIYLTLTGKYQPAVQSAAILTSCFSILGCHLAPKCYIMLFRKELNHERAIAEYIRKYYEQKGISVVHS
ncbi:G-protein coupled receptor family C group 6 member A-like [Oreochromis niloticus]|uniref:G-protein coupled receptor family C group 6 member A-like n=1 Tax=Oreochromis niloticus TaxID=8128 RepID=UPI000905292D|nr:G-protein coupled receptor family C group 6 member A-like [Oreochromis niloticus]